VKSQMWNERRSFDEKAGLFVWPGLMGTELHPKETALLEKYKPSGIVLFRRNMKTLSQSQRLISTLRDLLPHCKIAVDEEGGRVSRIPSPFPRGLPAEQLGTQGELGKQMARDQILHQGFVAKGLGIDVILAPVADIKTSDFNPGLEERCFGKHAHEVSEFVELAVETLKSLGIASCVKHFPGHGNTSTDTHHDFATSDVSLNTLRNREWVPFLKAIQMGVPFVMTGHVKLVQVDSRFPATLSSQILQGQLRQELGFEGLVLSDDLRMKAVAKHYGVEDSVVSAAIYGDVSGLAAAQNSGFLGKAAADALVAGCDIILSCQSVLLEAEIFEHLSQQMETNPVFFEQLASKLLRFEKGAVR
jgi:beta-N-acetylhexosaminidase